MLIYENHRVKFSISYKENMNEGKFIITGKSMVTFAGSIRVFYTITPKKEGGLKILGSCSC